MQKRHDYSAEEILRDRIRMEPACDEGYLRLAAFLSREGFFVQARDVLREGLARAERTAPLEHMLGLVLAMAGQAERAERYLAKAAEQEPGNSQYLRDLALAQGMAGKTAVAAGSLRQAVALAGLHAPVEGDGQGGKATELDGLMRLADRALAEQGIRAERRPPKFSPRTALIENLITRDPELAEAFLPLKGGGPQPPRETLLAVRRALRRLVDQHPSYADLYFGLSLVADALGQIETAIRTAEKALALNPRYAEAALLAMRLYEKQGRRDLAAERCRRVTELRPGWLDAHVNLGRLLSEQGRREQAAEAYRKALELDAGCEEARLGLAAVGAAAGTQGGRP